MKKGDIKIDLQSDVKPNTIKGIQEHLTNMGFKISYGTISNILSGRGNSNADKIKIDLQEHPAFYKLKFTDNGTKKINAQENGTTGIGLENMRERAEALNGTFNIYTDKGFAIHVVIPKMDTGVKR